MSGIYGLWLKYWARVWKLRKDTERLWGSFDSLELRRSQDDKPVKRDGGRKRPHVIHMEPLFLSATTYSPTHFRVQPGDRSCYAGMRSRLNLGSALMDLPDFVCARRSS